MKILFIFLLSFYQTILANDGKILLSSPNGLNNVMIENDGGILSYAVSKNQKPIISSSKLGFVFKNRTSIKNNIQNTHVNELTIDETWIQPWGEVKQIRDFYNQVIISFSLINDKLLTGEIIFRAYNDGVAFRYHINDLQGDSLIIMDELTEFNFVEDAQAWWIKAYQWNRYEYLYTQSKTSEMDTVHTPVTFRLSDGTHLSIHEAALTDFASMTLAHKEDTRFEVDLVPWSNGDRVRTDSEYLTPWRTIQIGNSAGELIESNLILNLNEPNVLKDVSWIKPGKYVGIWWGMHLGSETWHMGDKHGATTQNAIRYIDFAAQHGFDGVLIEGWNIGWNENWWDSGDVFSFTQPYPDFDIQTVAHHANVKRINIIGHHETSAGVRNYESQVDDAFDFYKNLGIHTIKTGYVGHGRGIKPVGGQPEDREWHHGQYMVKHYRSIVEKAAEKKIVLDVHEPIKPTGIRRTYPNMMTREGARGQEFNAWGANGGNPPDHTTILPFTRLLGGPMDFTPGIFELYFKEDRPDNRINTTLAKQLALYVVLYSPLHMAADLPANYEGNPAFQFIKDVPVDWDTTLVLNGEIGDFVTIVRKDRKSSDWYLGSITDEMKRELKIPLDFLDKEISYVAEIYKDGPNADWESNPYEISIVELDFTNKDIFQINLAPGGGQAIRFRAIK
jgi:alpha-glucosidase